MWGIMCVAIAIGGDEGKGEIMNHEDMKTIIESTFRDMIQMSKEPNRVDKWPKLKWPEYSPLRNSNKNESSHNHDLKRFSEQELKQTFIVQLKLKNQEVYYSVETPTLDGYNFSKDCPEIQHHKDGGQSGNFDLTIYDSNQIIQHHIEFKSGNPERKGITKDLLKLCNEPFCYEVREQLCHEVRDRLIDPDEMYKRGCHHYFIHILDRCELATLQSLAFKFLHKTKKQNINLPDGLKQLKTCINKCLNESKNHIHVYMLVLDNISNNKRLGVIQEKNAGIAQEKISGYYAFDYADDVDCIDWGACWCEYDGEDFKSKDMKDSVKQ